ncbi:MAG: glycosyltransferase family 2 protein, partial [Dehalococcoidia bacterium]
ASSEAFFDIPDAELPSVSLIVPAFEEASVLDDTLTALHDLDYPSYDVIVVDDASTDHTAAIAREHVATDRRFRLLLKSVNEGKAMAMNDAIRIARGEIIVIVDADACLYADALRYIAAHFVRVPRVAAVTGNPRVVNRTSFLAELQTLEFTSIVSILRRAQVVWGRVLTVSGVISAFRRSALENIGLFDPSMATEDIDASWRLQRKFYDIRYEPRAMVDMRVPVGIRALWHQRRRWATGLVQVMQRHGALLFRWRNRRQWPVVVEALASIVWAHCFLVVLMIWLAALIVGALPVAFSPFPNEWGMLIASLAILQLTTGVLIDRRYERSIVRALLVAPLYPLGYWLLMSVVTVRTTIPALLTKRRAPNVKWTTIREVTPPERVVAENLQRSA